MANSTLTTTNIGVEELKYLKKLASHHGLKQSEFINSAILFFRKTGINPSHEIHSPRESIEKLTKRVDEVIRFMQVHEKQKLTPLMERLIILEHNLKENYSKSNTSTKVDTSSLETTINSLKKVLEIETNKISYGIGRVPQLVKEDIDQLYRTQKKIVALISLLSVILKHSRFAAGVPDVDIKNLENALSEIR